MNFRPFIPLIISVAALAVAGGLYGAGYYLLMKLDTKSQALALQVADKNAELDRATRAQFALSTLASDEATLDQYTVPKAGIVNFLEALQTGGKALGTTVNVLSVSDAADGTHPRISLSLSITGSFDSVMRTLGAIEYSPYDGVVTNVTLTSPTGADGTATGKNWIAAVVYSVGVRSASSTPQKP